MKMPRESRSVTGATIVQPAHLCSATHHFHCRDHICAHLESCLVRCHERLSTTRTILRVQEDRPRNEWLLGYTIIIFVHISEDRQKGKTRVMEIPLQYRYNRRMKYILQAIHPRGFRDGPCCLHQSNACHRSCTSHSIALLPCGSA